MIFLKNFLTTTIIALIISLSTFTVQAQNDTTKVLFLGNSFTAVNGLANTFSQLSKSAGKIVYVEDNTPGGYTLNGHSQNATSLQMISSKKWDYVVLQEQSQIPSRISLRDSLMYPYAIILDSLIHQNSSCTQTVFFMTWGHKNGDLGLPQGSDTYEDMQIRLRSGYMTIADSVGALVSPVGWAWRYVRQNNPSIELYLSDDYHPAMEGTYLAACTFFATIFEQTPVGIPYTAGLSSSTVQSLQFAAGKIVLDSLVLWNHGVYNPNPNVSFSQNISLFQVQFLASAINADSVFWDFGDGTTSTDLNPIHNYQSSGNYSVILIGKNECGADTFKYNISIIPNSNQNTRDNSPLILYPNPTNGVVNIDFSNQILPYKIEIRSLLGQLLFDRDYEKTDQQISIDLSPLNSGFYNLIMYYKTGEIKTLKVIRQ